MTNKEFFIASLQDEQKAFINVLKAVPADQPDFKPHERSRTAKSLMQQLASQSEMISKIINVGVLDFNKPYTDEKAAMDTIIPSAEKNFEQLIKDLTALSDEEWENGEAAMLFGDQKWPDKKYKMSWSFLFDAIHHRGQLSVYVRLMGGKVPSIYGPSADAPI
jgi:uncharacterized damage-inducible protein DinB